jgi:raffinose/stachyose/melibiose transport system substrate-binding protein
MDSTPFWIISKEGDAKMNARSKASFAILAVMIILSVLLSSCGAKPSTAPATAAPVQPATQAPLPAATAVPPAQPKVKIIMWDDTLSVDATKGKTCYQDYLVAPFNAQSQTTEVDVTLLANLWDAQLTALQGGAGPDIVEAPGPSLMNQLAKAGKLYGLDDYATQYGWDTALAPWALKLGVVNGKIYSLPNQVETVVLYYNKTLFEQHGWQPPKTVDELVALAEKIQAAGIIPFAHSNAEWKGVNEWFVGELMNHVAGPQKVYDALTGKIPWTDPAFVTSIDILNNMQQKGWFMGGMDRYYTAADAERFQAFADGKAAMDINGTWAIEGYADYFGEKSAIKADWGWVPTPSASGATIFDLGIGNSYGINAKTANPDNVAEFLNYLYLPDTQSTLLAKCGTVPGPIKVNKALLTEQDPRYLEILDQLYAAAESNNVGYTTWTFWPPKSETYIIDNIEKVWAGTMTTQDYLAGLQAQFAEEAAAGDVPPIPAR